jgi:N-acyl-D-amino-acid deacylase
VGRFHITIPKLLKNWNIPGGTLAVIKDGRLVLAEGYGLADREAKARAKPETLFRIASASKPFTAVGILKLIQEGKMHLEDKAFAVLNDLSVFPGATPDPRLADITVRDLLRHSGGWDSSITDDPQ